jgi:tetratricopeptide (TPR) repeat protein
MPSECEPQVKVFFNIGHRMSSSANTVVVGKKSPRIYSREAVLFGCILLLILFVLFTAAVSRMYHKSIHVLADNWFEQGEASFRAGDIKSALTDYRNALVYSPANAKFQFHLAQALAAAGRGDEGRSYLLNLLSESPGSGDVNLVLARIAAHKGLTSDALRYYHGAIYGEWDNDPIGRRWQVRRELAEYLLDRGLQKQAGPEIIALADSTPANDTEQLRVAGNLLLKAKLWTRALDAFRTVLYANPNDEDALLGAATSAFNLGQYSAALDYFDRLPEKDRNSPEVAEMYKTTQQINEMNPFLPDLSHGAKARRAASALFLATARLQQCASQVGQSLTTTPRQSQLQKAFVESKELAADESWQSIAKHPETVDVVMSHAFEMENAAVAACGEPEGADRALWLLGRSRGVSAQ